jgi:hypothetical protein
MIEDNEAHFFKSGLWLRFYSVATHIELIRSLDPNWPIKLSKGKKSN